MFFNEGNTGKIEWWMYILGSLVVALAYLFGQIPLLIALMVAINNDPNLEDDALAKFQENPDFGLFGIDANVGFLLLLLMFVFACVALYLIVRFLHKKKWKSIITARRKVDWGRILFAFFLWMGMTVVFEGINMWINPEEYIYTFDWQKFLPLLAISLLILPIQTSFEEFFFRGYLMQGIGIGIGTKWAPLIITSIFFGLIHSFNPEVEEFGFYTMQFYYVSAGLLLGILTIMDDGMELSLGVHAATNMYGAMIVGYNGAAIQTDAIFKTDSVNATLMTAIFFISAFLFYLICSKKYSWKPISKLLDDVIIRTNEEYV